MGIRHPCYVDLAHLSSGTLRPLRHAIVCPKIVLRLLLEQNTLTPHINDTVLPDVQSEYWDQKNGHLLQMHGQTLIANIELLYWSGGRALTGGGGCFFRQTQQAQSRAVPSIFRLKLDVRPQNIGTIGASGAWSIGRINAGHSRGHLGKKTNRN